MAFEYLEPARFGGRQRPFDSLLALNHALDRITTGRLVNEPAIEAWLEQLQTDVSANDPCFWLLLARLTELAVVCAGRYADACEFAAAGDLLVNPRQIRVHFSGDTPPVVKHRHGALSEQFNAARVPYQDFIRWFPRSAAVEIVKKPLLTFFTERMETSGMLHVAYLDNLRTRIGRIAETLGFLSSWQVTDAADFQRRCDAAGPETRRFVRSHLCNFNLNQFSALGRDVRRLVVDRTASSDFLVPAVYSLRAGDRARHYRHA